MFIMRIKMRLVHDTNKYRNATMRGVREDKSADL